VTRILRADGARLPSGKLLLRFKRPLGNGTVAIELEPLALMRRLASLVPPPGRHDTSYYGVFAANSAWRSRLVRALRKAPEGHGHPGWNDEESAVVTLPAEPDLGMDGGGDGSPERYIPWAELLRRVHGVDVLRCSCGWRRKVLAYVTAKEEIRQSLERLGLWTDPPKVARAREPPQAELFERAPPGCDGVDPPAPDPVA